MPNAENGAPDNWLTRELERARKRREALPKWARPVVVKPLMPASYRPKGATMPNAENAALRERIGAALPKGMEAAFWTLQDWWAFAREIRAALDASVIPPEGGHDA